MPLADPELVPPGPNEADDAIEFLVRNGELNDRDLTRSVLERGVRTIVYGPYLSRMCMCARDQIEAGRLDAHASAKGLGIASTLYQVSNRSYLAQELHISGDALVEHQKAILAGELHRVDPQFAMTVPNAIHQVITADLAFCGDTDDRGYQGAVAAANYGAIFRDQTMTSGVGITERLRANSPATWENDSYTAMSHLDISNANIAQTLEGILLYASLRTPQRARVRIFDVGSGHGATDAAFIQTIKLRGRITNMPEVAITCLEQTPHFYDDLVEFTQGPDGARVLGLEPIQVSVNGGHLSQFGALATVFGNAPTALAGLDISHMGGKDEIIVVTANYSFHRLASDKKREIIEKFSQMENVIFLVGDLKQNISWINLESFDIAANGPPNTGNRKTTELFSRSYGVIDLAEAIPCGIDSRIAERLVLDSITPGCDGHLWIAVKGALAWSSLGLVSAPSEINQVISDSLERSFGTVRS
ncbi:MAG TPA: hypothetical protein PKB15_02155 [Acidimicrobiia bacterium]|nr:hypothetical protein [Acidimicrobiia bacterium]